MSFTINSCEINRTEFYFAVMCINYWYRLRIPHLERLSASFDLCGVESELVVKFENAYFFVAQLCRTFLPLTLFTLFKEQRDLLYFRVFHVQVDESKVIERLW